MEALKKSLDEIVFENRNKAYGAFYLRRIYPNHIKRSLFITSLLFCVSLGGPFLYNKYFKKQVQVKKEEVVEVDLAKVEIPPLDPTTPPPPPPPPPPKVEKPKVKTIKKVPPKVVPDEEVVIEEIIPTEDDLEDAVISNVTQEGEPDTLGLNDIPEGDPNGVVGGTGEVTDDQIYMPGAGIQASFPGGQGAFQEYLSKKMKPYVDKAAKLGDKGTVYVMFIVEKDGSISNVEAPKGLAICTSCNEAAKKIIENMPKWEPAKNNGYPVRLKMVLPIRFDFED